MTGPASAQQANRSLASPAASLSAQVREATADLHGEIEKKLRLPHSIETLAQYKTCLTRFYTLYRPLEARLAQFHEWPLFGFDLAASRHTPSLVSDLEVLGCGPELLPDLPPGSLPELATFPQALGALYVLEGSTLGSTVILKFLSSSLGAQIAGADHFFRSRGKETYPHWSHFSQTLNSYGENHPDSAQQVILGARTTFRAIGDWMET
jgi:heme oxygenase